MSTITNSNLSIPKLIKTEVDEFQSVTMERDKNIKMQMEMENLVRERDWLKKEVDLLEKTQSFTELEKCSAEEKLERSERRCQEFDEKFVQMEEMFTKLKQKEIDSEKAVQFYRSRVDDLEPRLLKVEATLAKLLKLDFVKLDKFAAAAVDVKAEENLQSPDCAENAELKTDEGASYPMSFTCRSALKTIDVIKDNLEKENLEKFEQSCFGNLLKINEFKCQGQLILQLLLHMDMSASNEKRLIFKINNSIMEFGPSDFSRITGLCCTESEVTITATSSSIHKNVFRGRSFITLKDVREGFLKISSCHKGKGELTLKLALLYFLYGTLLTKHFRNKIDVQHLHLIEDLQQFNAFPWGQVAYHVLVSSILGVRLRMDDSEVTHQVTRFDIYGFCYALQVWAYELMPSIAAYCASRVNYSENMTPYILRWSATRILTPNDAKNLFPLGDKAHLQNNTRSKATGKKRKLLCGNDQMPYAQPSSAATITTAPPPSMNASTFASHQIPRRLYRIDDKGDESSPTLTRHSKSGPNPVSTNKATNKLERLFVEPEQARALSELTNDRDMLKVYFLSRFKATTV